jgi:hypothetical protein
MKCETNPNLRFNRKSQNENERKVFQNYWKELAKMYGTWIDYFVYDYQLSAHDFFYGEQPLAPFRVPSKGMSILAEFQNDSLLMAKWGMVTEADVVFIIPIQTFYETFGFHTEPKAGDLIRMTELGWDRPGSIDDLNIPNIAPITACDDTTNPLEGLCNDGIVEYPASNCTTDSNAYSGYDIPSAFNQLLRGAPVFEITERRDENLTLHYNPLQGHYVWIIHAKRFDYSYQPNAPREPGSSQLSDETISGLISTNIDNLGYPVVSGLPMLEDIKQGPKNYNQNIEDEAKKNWDYDTLPGGADPEVYGNY